MRLFVAVNLPPALRRDLWRAAEPLRRADLPVKWVPADHLHLTLKFLGEVEPGRRPEIEAAVTASVQGARRFTVGVGGFGAFPAVERPNVIWVGCEGIPPLELLQHRVEVETERLGFPGEARAFRPHVTLGRARRGAGPARFRELAGLLADATVAGEFAVESLDLMESRGGPDGSVYHLVHSAALAA
jgi:2'-5' RNA ligase